MDRTIASAALITTAVAGLTGCMTVSPQPAPDEGKIVQAPAREALESLRHARRAPKVHRSKPPKPRPRHRTEPQPALPYVPLPRLPIPQPALRPVAPPQLPQRPDACSFGRDFNQYQSGGEKVNLC